MPNSLTSDHVSGLVYMVYGSEISSELSQPQEYKTLVLL